MKLLRPALLTLTCLLVQPTLANDLLRSATPARASCRRNRNMCSGAPAEPAAGQVKQLSDPQLKDYVENSVYRTAETSQLQDRRLNSSCSTARS